MAKRKALTGSTVKGLTFNQLLLLSRNQTGPYQTSVLVSVHVGSCGSGRRAGQPTVEVRFRTVLPRRQTFQMKIYNTVRHGTPADAPRRSQALMTRKSFSDGQTGSLFGWRCQISYADVGDISSHRGIDYNGEDILVTPAQCAGKYIKYICSLAVRYL